MQLHDWRIKLNINEDFKLCHNSSREQRVVEVGYSETVLDSESELDESVLHTEGFLVDV